MATINPTYIAAQADKKHVYTWSTVTESDTCAAVIFQEVPQDISVQITGTWGGATATIVGDNGAGSGVACSAIVTAAASWTANALFSLAERPGSATPTFAGGSSQSLTITLIAWY